MKELLLALLKNYFIPLIIVAAVLLLVISNINSCKEKKQQSAIHTANVAMVRAELVDSLVSDRIQDSINLIKKQLYDSEKVIKKQDKQISQLKEDAFAYANAYELEPVHSLNADSSISKFKKTVQAQSLQIDTLKEDLFKCGKLADKQNDMINVKTRLATNYKLNNDALLSTLRTCEKNNSRKIHLTGHVGYGANTDSKLQDWRLGWSATLGLSYTIF